MKKYEVQIEEQIDEKNESNSSNSKKLKQRLIDNKIYFETIVMFCLSFMSIVVTIASVVISYSELSLTNTQTQILVAQNTPNIIYTGIFQESDTNYENYQFENIGGTTQKLSAYMTDDIIIHIVKDNFMYFVDIHVNGRFSKSKAVSGTNGQTILVQGDNNFFNVTEFVEDIRNELSSFDDCEITFTTSQRVILSYINHAGAEQRVNYALLNEKLVEDGSYENPYYNCRKDEIEFNCITGNKEDLLKTITSRVETILHN